MDYWTLWRSSWNMFLKDNGVTEQYLGLDESVVPALVHYRYHKDGRYEDMYYDYKWAFPTTFAATAVRKLLLGDPNDQCRWERRNNGCDACEHTDQCFDANQTRQYYLSLAKKKAADQKKKD